MPALGPTLGAWYLQFRLGQPRPTGLHRAPFPISLGCIASPTPKVGSFMSERPRVSALD